MIPSNKKHDYEMVKTDDWVLGTIKDIERDEHHKTFFQGKEAEKDCVRLVFELEGYEYPHKSRWMTFNYSEKANLYNKYLISLVDGISPYCYFDIEKLKGLRIKTMWKTEKGKDGNDYQTIEIIRPAGEKIKYVPPTHNDNEIDLNTTDAEPDEAPF